MKTLLEQRNIVFETKVNRKKYLLNEIYKYTYILKRYYRNKTKTKQQS